MSSGRSSGLSHSQHERQRSGVRWDEPNLEENERIKAELQPIRIDEPKTPYHGPMPEEESDDGSAHMAPLALEDEDHTQAGVTRENGDADRMEQMEARFSSDLDAAVSPPRHTSWEGSIPSGRRAYASSEDEELQAEKRRRFEERRKKHYHISEAARQALHRQAEELAKRGTAGDREDEGEGNDEENQNAAAPM